MDAAGCERPQLMTPGEIEGRISALGGLVKILADAKPKDRQNVYRQPGLRLAYHLTPISNFSAGEASVDGE
ncbi:hypothetical protein [Actinomadura macra]|uniref:hypothetical protein n=1 Tax=Actinomadura macra TaxID=46164 RepID=UPI0008309AAD|nr:hypothetical protein [Actinomadura macra]